MKSKQESLKDRVTVVEQVVHYSPRSGRTYPHEIRYAYETETVEQPWERAGFNCYATEEWKPLDLGWIQRASMICIRNEEGKGWDRMGEGEKKALKERKLELKLGDLSYPSEKIVIYPQRDARFCVENLKNIFMRSAKGLTNYSLFICPE